jgi:hypothetical protein
VQSETPAAPDPVAAELGYLRACIDAAATTPEAFDLAVLLPRLGRSVAAVEAVLGAHPSQTTANGLQVCPNCTRDMSVFVPADRCLIRSAISRELLANEERRAG